MGGGELRTDICDATSCDSKTFAAVEFWLKLNVIFTLLLSNENAKLSPDVVIPYKHLSSHILSHIYDTSLLFTIQISFKFYVFWLLTRDWRRQKFHIPSSNRTHSWEKLVYVVKVHFLFWYFKELFRIKFSLSLQISLFQKKKRLLRLRHIIKLSSESHSLWIFFLTFWRWITKKSSVALFQYCTQWERQQTAKYTTTTHRAICW